VLNISSDIKVVQTEYWCVVCVLEIAYIENLCMMDMGV
jgi:hypothetical protein